MRRENEFAFCLHLRFCGLQAVCKEYDSQSEEQKMVRFSLLFEWNIVTLQQYYKANTTIRLRKKAWRGLAASRLSKRVDLNLKIILLIC